MVASAASGGDPDLDEYQTKYQSRSGPLATAARAIRAEAAWKHESPGQGYSMRRPEIARAMTSCWICSVPSKMS
jgi:hypothetical protein